MKSLLLLMVCVLGSSWAAAQDFDFRPPASATDPAASAVMRDLAERILPVYQENDQERYLRNLSGLQLVAGNAVAGWQTRQQLRDRRKSVDARRPIGRSVIFDIYAYAKSREAQDKGEFPKTYQTAYRAIMGPLSDQDAYNVTGWLEAPVTPYRDAVQRAFDQWRPKGSIPLADAVDLIWNYLTFDAYRSFHPLIAALNEEDNARRYVTDWDVLIKTPDGANISAVVVRPKDESKPLPALLEFTIYVDSRNFARECAAHGYVGIVAFTRGERRSRGPVTPFKFDGDDARIVIDWIAKQPWSDGRVGMYGGTYSAFAEWAAARHLPPALKAIATHSATAPGIDFPMTGNIVRNAGYRWSGCVSNLPEFDEKTCADDARWRALDEAWYASGKPYRDLEHALGGTNRIFHDWLDHPSYDRYWQKLIPHREQFRHVRIPVLATTGYYAGGEVGTLHYFTEHYKADPHANHTLLIGPYEDGSMQHGTAANLQGYVLDPAALLDLRELRYQWFDHVFKGAEKPALLQDRVNYEVMGSNEWRHAPTIEAMGRGALKFYLDSAVAMPGGDTRRLSLRKSSEKTFVQHTVNLADRADSTLPAPNGILSRSLQIRTAVVFVSEPLSSAQVASGLFSGKLDFTINRMDVDLSIAMYELLPSGDYLALFDPAYEFRASYAQDRATRQLLRAGERQQLAFRSDRMMSRKLEAGSRVVVVLSVNKRPDRQINYGTGHAVNQETLENGRTPVRIRWYSDSYIDLPVSR